MPHGQAQLGAVLDLPRTTSRLVCSSRLRRGARITSDGIRYSNIEPDQEISAAPCRPASPRPRRNQWRAGRRPWRSRRSSPAAPRRRAGRSSSDRACRRRHAIADRQQLARGSSRKPNSMPRAPAPCAAAPRAPAGARARAAAAPAASARGRGAVLASMLGERTARLAAPRTPGRRRSRGRRRRASGRGPRRRSARRGELRTACLASTQTSTAAIAGGDRRRRFRPRGRVRNRRRRRARASTVRVAAPGRRAAHAAPAPRR